MVKRSASLGFKNMDYAPNACAILRKLFCELPLPQEYGSANITVRVLQTEFGVFEGNWKTDRMEQMAPENMYIKSSIRWQAQMLLLLILSKLFSSSLLAQNFPSHLSGLPTTLLCLMASHLKNILS